MQKKYFVFDIDGTLMKPGQNKIDNDGIAAIKLAQKYGDVILATARPLIGVLNLYIKDNLHIDNIIALNGALIFSHSKIIQTTPIPSLFVKYLIEHIEEFRNLWLFSESNWYANNMTTKECIKEINAIQSSCLSFDQYSFSEDVLKVTIVDQVNENKALKLLCASKFDNRVAYSNSHTNFHEFNSVTINKYLALKSILENNDYFAIGDSNNDIELIENSKFGCCVNNGSIHAKSSAKFVSQFEYGKGSLDCVQNLIQLFSNESK